MRWRRVVWPALVLASGMAWSQDQSWLPVTDQELKFSAPAGDAGTIAVQLYFANYIDVNDHSEFYYRRVKILSEAGREYGDVTIPLPGKLKVQDLQARTIHPDGSIVLYRDAPFEKTILNGRGLKYRAQSFTFPDFTVGSIVEYKYKLRNDYYRPEWIVEHNLFTVKESFRIKYSGLELYPVISPGVAKELTRSKGLVTLEMENVPAFQAEAQMPPEENYKKNITFVPAIAGYSSADFFWTMYLRAVNAGLQAFIGNHHEIKTLADGMVGKMSNSEQKLQYLYSRAQEVRNLSYERHRTGAEQKQENLKENKNVVDVLKHGYGTQYDINLFFVALARAAGFKADLVLVSNRAERFFRKEIPSPGELDSSLVYVNLDKKELYLDPGTRFCPYGIIRWMRASTEAAFPAFGGGRFFKTRDVQQNEAVINRIGHATLAEDGSLHAEVLVIFLGGEALERRLAALETDEAGRNKSLEEEVKSWLPRDSTVNIVESQGWEEGNQPLRAKVEFDVPGYASLAGKRILLPTSLFPWRQKEVFSHSDRKYPVYFPYAFSEIDKISFKVPQGYSVETGQEKDETRLPYASYRKTVAIEGDEVKTERYLLFNAIFVEPNGYSTLRDFFAKVKAGDDAQEILRAQAAAAAAKD